MVMVTAKEQALVDKIFLNKVKAAYRARKKKYEQIAQKLALPPVPTVFIPDDYINPVTLNKAKYGPVVYKVRDASSGRVNYYNKSTFWSLMRNTGIKNNYQLLMAMPKNALFKNPVTRGPVKPRNVTRVRVKPAAAKIQSAVRRLIKKKKSTKK